MKATVLALALSASLLACSKKQEDPPAGGGDRCAAAINKAIDGMTAQRTSAAAPDLVDEIANKLRATFITRCQADHWPQPVLDCFAKATDMPSIRNCRTQLPPDQAQRIQAEIIQAMTGGAGGMPAAVTPPDDPAPPVEDPEAPAAP